MTPFLIFVALMLLTFCKNRGWGLEHNLFGVQIEENLWRQSFMFLCFNKKKEVLSRFFKFFGDGSNFCEKFSFPKLILDKYLKLCFPKV